MFNVCAFIVTQSGLIIVFLYLCFVGFIGGSVLKNAAYFITKINLRYWPACGIMALLGTIHLSIIFLYMFKFNINPVLPLLILFILSIFASGLPLEWIVKYPDGRRVDTGDRLKISFIANSTLFLFLILFIGL